MPTIQFKRGLWVRLVVAVAILVIPASLYFFTYFNSKYDFSIQQRFRTLNELERQFNRGLANFDNLFRFSKFQDFTPTEKKEARQVVSDFRAYLSNWEDWEEGEQSDHETTEENLHYRVLHKKQELISSKINEKLNKLNTIREESGVLDEFLDEQIYSILLDEPSNQLRPLLDRNKGSPDSSSQLQRSLQKTAYLDALNALIRKSQKKEEAQRLQAFADQLESVGNHLYKQYSKVEQENISLEERLKAIKKELGTHATAVAASTTSVRKAQQPPMPDELKPDTIMPLWKKYIHADIETWLKAWIRFNKCVHSSGPADSAQNCKKKHLDLAVGTDGKAINADDIVGNLERELDSGNHYLQKLATSPIYGNLGYSAVNSKDCDESSQDSRATKFSVITSMHPYRLSVTDACVNQLHTRYTWQNDNNGKGIGRVLEAQLPLRDLIQPDRALRYFDQILILNSEGRVVYRSGEEEQVSVNNDSGPPLLANQNDFARYVVWVYFYK